MDRDHLKRSLMLASSRGESPSTSTSRRDFPLTSTPSFDIFDISISIRYAEKKFRQDLQVGDFVFGKVKRVDPAGAHVKLICVGERMKRHLDWLDIVLVVPLSSLENRVSAGDYVKLVVSRLDSKNPDMEIVTARLSEKDLPLYFREGKSLSRDDSFPAYVESKRQMLDRSVESEWSLPTSSQTTFLFSQDSPSSEPFLNCEKASFLRKRQEESVARRSVEKGVQAVKEKDFALAHRHLDYAISIWPDCVDAYVSKGAAFANEGKLADAEKELNTALAKDPQHANGRNYLVEVLLIRVDKHVKAGELDDALKDAKKAVSVKPEKKAQRALHEVEAAIAKTRTVITIEDEQKSEEELRRERERQKEMELEKQRKARADKQKLQDMERFIEELKKQK